MKPEIALKILWDYCMHNEETKEVYKVLKNAIRPQGEWLLNKDETPKCPFCHHSFTYWGNFCGNCGADMRGGESNE